MPAAAPDLDSTCRAIERMEIRGANRIGVEAAMALARHVAAVSGDLAVVHAALRDGATRLAATRPTAVSLRHGIAAVARPVLDALDAEAAREAAREAGPAFEGRVRDAQAAIARAGAALVPDGATLLTHCHATSVVDVLAQVVADGKQIEVYATETRPFGQGRITARALADAGVPVTLIVDSAAYHVLADRGVDQVLVGADTVTRDGTLLNKIGTRAVAAAANALAIPLRSAAASYKFTPELPGAVPIEERDPAELTGGAAIPGVRVYNPVFDATPSEHITAYITEHGVLAPVDAVAVCTRGLEEVLAWQ